MQVLDGLVASFMFCREGWGGGVRGTYKLSCLLCQQPSVSIIRYTSQMANVHDWLGILCWVLEASLSWTDFHVSFFTSCCVIQNFVGEYASIIFFVLRKHFTTTLLRRNQHFSSFHFGFLCSLLLSVSKRQTLETINKPTPTEAFSLITGNQEP